MCTGEKSLVLQRRIFPPFFEVRWNPLLSSRNTSNIWWYVYLGKIDRTSSLMGLPSPQFPKIWTGTFKRPAEVVASGTVLYLYCIGWGAFLCPPTILAVLPLLLAGVDKEDKEKGDRTGQEVWRKGDWWAQVSRRDTCSATWTARNVHPGMFLHEHPGMRNTEQVMRPTSVKNFETSRTLRWPG